MRPNRADLRFRAATGALALLLGACAPSAPPPAAPPPPRVAPSEAAALAALMQMEDTRTVDLDRLRTLAGDSSALVRRQTALALGRLRPPPGAPLLVHLLQDPDSAVAATAAFALGRLADSSAVTPLVAALSQPAERVTVAAEAARALGALEDPVARQALLGVLDSTSPPSPAPAVGEALLAIWRSGVDPATVRTLTHWTRVDDPELRWRAAYALARRPVAVATPVLLELAGDPEPRVRALAARGLTAALADSAGLDVTRVLDAVLALSADADYTVRINALRTLGSYSPSRPRAAQRLAAVIQEPDPHAAFTAAEALEPGGTAARAAVPALQTVARDPTRPEALRVAAAAALASVDSAAAAALLAGWVDSGSWRLRAAAARGLASTSTAGVPAQLLHDPDDRVALAAFQAALAATPDDAGTRRALVLGGLGHRDPVVRAAALQGLVESAGPFALPLVLDAYQRALGDRQNDAALAAVDALADLHRQGLASPAAFFARFPRADDYLVRRRVLEAFGEAAERRWGDALPAVTPSASPSYSTIVQQLVVPALQHGLHPRVQLQTASDTLVLELLPEHAPLTVASFLHLARDGFFDGQEWPRVVPAFVVQGGDPRGDMSGGPGYTIRDEPNRLRYRAGSMGMALAGPDTGGSQFFITLWAQPHLDGDYTIFGRLVEGMDSLRSLLPGQRIHRVQLLQCPEDCPR